MPHRKRVQHFHEPGQLHEFTFSCYRRLPLLTNDRWRERLARAIDGKGAFRRFKDVLHQKHPHLLPAWHAFRETRAQRRAVDWLVDNSLIDDDAATRFLNDHPDPDVP